MAAKDTRIVNPISFLHGLGWDEIPENVQHQAKRCLLDLLGVAAGGHGTKLSRIIRDHAAEDMPGQAPMLFDDRRSNLAGAAMAAGMMIDSLDGHDGYNPVKGHIGCPTLPALVGFSAQRDSKEPVSGRDFLTALVVAYEMGGRIGKAQHASCPDYHTSGSWGAVAAAAVGARLMRLDLEQTRHALGIAEYHGPRSQMMRCIDYPTMVKDGSGWGALCGISAVQLARRGFTGAPALTVEAAKREFADLGANWVIQEQYFKPYPVCRWAQAPVEAALALRAKHDLTSDHVQHIEIETFHESCRLATARPQSTEEAQYSTSFPVAVALVRGRVEPKDVEGAALSDPEILRLSEGLKMSETEFANSRFPNERFARVKLFLKSGDAVQSDYAEPRWSAWDAPSDQELTDKYFELAAPVLGKDRANTLHDCIWTLDASAFKDLAKLLFSAPNG